jgi:hypothetical protein
MRLTFYIAACSLLPAACGIAAEPPAFVLHSIRDDLPAGPLVRLSSDGTAQVGTAELVGGPGVVAIRRQGQSPPHFPHDRAHAHFANGDRIPGRIISIANDKVRFLADLGTPQELNVPLSALAAVWLTDAAAVRAAMPAGRKTLAEKRRQDVAILSNGDTARGTIVEWPADGPLRLDVDGKQIDVTRDRIQSLLLNSDLARALKPVGTYRQIVLANGARLSVRTAELAGDELRTTTLTGAIVRVPLTALAAVNVYQGAAVYLSDLSPRAYEHTSYFGARWPIGIDRSVAGLDLRLGNGTYDKGIGLHSQCRVTYGLPKHARRFEAVVGLDDQTGRSGGVRVQLFADGTPFAESMSLSGGEPPRSVRLALPPGARELAVAVDFGRGGDVQDHVNWGDARVIVDGTAGR